MIRYFILAFLFLSPFLGWSASADEPAANEPPTIKLTLHPAAPASPALKYTLLPHRTERKPGNAAPFYYRSLLLYYQNQGRQELQKQEMDNAERWHSEPCEGEVREEIKKWLASFPPSAVSELREAVYREECRFDFRLGERNGLDIISFLLPEIQDMRGLGRYLQLKARVEISEGRFADAVESLRSGYRISQDVATEPLLINGLVGVAVSTVMNSDVEQWIGTPNSPNLYWALTAIPTPLVDLRPALETEVRFPERMFAYLKDAETTQRTPEEWQRLMRDTVRQVGTDFQNVPSELQSPFDQVQHDLATTALLIRAYSMARTELTEAGFDAAKLDKMPVGQAVAIHMQRVIRYIADEYAKGAYLPAHEREKYFASLDERMARERFMGPGSRESIPIASRLMPAVGQALSAQTRLERDFAALRTLEAIRAHLAETGSLPEKLGDIKVLPVPVNPATGELFEYRLADGQATLLVPSVNKRQSPLTGKRYVLTAAKK